MTVTVLNPVSEVSSDDAEPVNSGGPSRRRLLLLAGFAVVTTVRILAIQRSPFPNVIADEVAYLSMAREISGRGGWNLGRAVLYSPAYSVLIAPLAALGWTGETMYRGAEYVNAVLGGCLFLALHAFIVRIGRIRPPWTIPVAAITSSLPALVLTTNFVWSDNLAPLVFVCACLALLRLVDRPTLSRYLVAGTVSIVAYAAHGRFAPVVAAMVLLAVALRVQRRLSSRNLILGTLAVIAQLVVVYLATNALYARLYEPGGEDGYGTSDLAKFTQVWNFTLAVLGQLWYVVISTAGLAGVGIMTLGRDLTERVRARRAGLGPGHRSGPTLTALTSIILLMGAEFAVSATYMTAAGRADTVIYGRYNDPVTSVLATTGLAALLAVMRIRRRAIDLSLIVILGAGVPFLFRHIMFRVLNQDFYIRSTIIGVTVINGDPIHHFMLVAGWGAAAAVVLVGVAALPAVVRSRRAGIAGPALVLIVAAILTSWGIMRGVDLIGTDAVEDPSSITSVAPLLEPDDVITYASPSYKFTNELKPFYVYPTVEPSVHFVRTLRPTSEITAELVMAPADDPALAANGYRIPWTDPHRDLALWVAPGPRQDELARQHHLLPQDWQVSLPVGRNGLTDVDIRIDRTRLSGSVVIRRETGTPWAVVSEGGDSIGRIRVSVRVFGPDGTEKDDLRADPQRDWIDADVSRLRVPIDLEADTAIGSEDRVEVQLISEGVYWFGNEVTIRP